MASNIRTLLALVLVLAGCGGSAGAPPQGAGGELRLWQDAAIFGPVQRLVAGAGGGVALWVEMYEFDRPDLAAALRLARDRGADVRLIVDPTVPESARTADALRAVGVPVRRYPVDDRRFQIDHVKLLVSGEEALVGGMNWGLHSAANHDYAFETRAPALVRRLRAIFEQDWAMAGGRPRPLPFEDGPVAQTAPGEEVRARLLGALGAARRSVEAEVFVLTDPDILAAMAAASRRGARVRVLLDAGQEVNRPTFQLLHAAGIEARWFPMPDGGKLHAKAGLFDGQWLLIGSANWSHGGLSVNHELDLLTGDAATASAFADRFERDWSVSGWPAVRLGGR